MNPLEIKTSLCAYWEALQQPCADVEIYGVLKSKIVFSTLEEERGRMSKVVEEPEVHIDLYLWVQELGLSSESGVCNIVRANFSQLQDCVRLNTTVLYWRVRYIVQEGDNTS